MPCAQRLSACACTYVVYNYLHRFTHPVRNSCIVGKGVKTRLGLCYIPYRDKISAKSEQWHWSFLRCGSSVHSVYRSGWHCMFPLVWSFVSLGRLTRTLLSSMREVEWFLTASLRTVYPSKLMQWFADTPIYIIATSSSSSSHGDI